MDENLRHIALQIVTSVRDTDSSVDFYLAYHEAAQLNEAGLGLSIAKQDSLLGILCEHNYAQLGLTLDIYEKVTKTSLESAIRSFFDSDLHDIFSSIGKSIMSHLNHLNHLF